MMMSMNLPRCWRENTRKRRMVSGCLEIADTVAALLSSSSLLLSLSDDDDDDEESDDSNPLSSILRIISIVTCRERIKIQHARFKKLHLPCCYD